MTTHWTRTLALVVMVAGCTGFAWAAPPQEGPDQVNDADGTAILPCGVQYELQEGSTLSYHYLCEDSTRPCVVTTNLRGTFERIPANLPDLYWINRIHFVGDNTASLMTVTGRGRYQAQYVNEVPENMNLRVYITGFPHSTNELVVLDSGQIWEPEGAFPTIIIDVVQLVSSMRGWYSMRLIATPKQYVDFSTQTGFAVVHPGGTERWISDGDLLRDRGYVVRTNNQLMRNFVVMPPTPDVGLDAVARCPWPLVAEQCEENDPTAARPPHLFSIEESIWCESLDTWLGEGDLLCECGFVFRTNAELLRNFLSDAAVAAVGLDAVHVHRNGEVWFSTEEGFTVSDPTGETRWISPSSLLSERGHVVRTIRQLLARFHAVTAVPEPGLDAVHVLPNGEIYFSLEVGFQDAVYGHVSPGDLLSDAGYVVARNYELLRPFRPTNVRDAGLDAVTLSPARNITLFDGIDAVEPAENPTELTR